MIFERKTITLGQLAAREIELTGTKRLATEQLRVAELAAGDSLAEGDGAAEMTEIDRLKTKLNGCAAAIRSLRSRRPSAILEGNLETAKKLRSEAAVKQRHLDELNGKTSKVLAELSRLQGVRFTDDILYLQPSTELGICGGVMTPKSETLLLEIRATEHRASILESAAVPADGYIDMEAVTSDDEVIKAALLSQSDAPSAEATADWLLKVGKDARLGGTGFGNRPRRVRLVWNRGVINLRDSEIFCGELAHRLSNSTTSINVASGTFGIAA